MGILKINNDITLSIRAFKEQATTFKTPLLPDENKYQISITAVLAAESITPSVVDTITDYFNANEVVSLTVYNDNEEIVWQNSEAIEIVLSDIFVDYLGEDGIYGSLSFAMN